MDSGECDPSKIDLGRHYNWSIDQLITAIDCPTVCFEESV